VRDLTVTRLAAREAGVMEILVVCVLMLIGVIYGYYTVEGSGIAEHPYRDVYGGAPGAFAPASVSGHDESISMRNWSRGTR
jgi:hypothetical protein